MAGRQHRLPAKDQRRSDKCAAVLATRVFSFEERIYEFMLVEHLQMVDTLSYANVFYRNLELVGDADNEATFSRSVKFADRKSRTLGRGREWLGSFKSVLPG